MGPTLPEKIIPHTITLLLQISKFSQRNGEISFPHFYVLQTCYHQIQKRWFITKGIYH